MIEGLFDLEFVLWESCGVGWVVKVGEVVFGLV